MIIRNILLKGLVAKGEKKNKQEENLEQSIDGHDLCYQDCTSNIQENGLNFCFHVNLEDSSHVLQKDIVTWLNGKKCTTKPWFIKTLNTNKPSRIILIKIKFY